MYMVRPCVLFLLGLFVMLCFFCSGCSDKKAEAPQQPDTLKGFAFFDLGANSHYSSAVRRRLEAKLGSDAISQQNVIDLTLFYSSAFFKKHFPALYDLNRRLNLPEGQRVEHNTTKLMYRYARLKETPFKDITLYFSNDTGNPLFFSISAGPGGAAIVETLKKKYGPPEQFKWEEEKNTTLYWIDDKDYFIVTTSLDRLGNPEYLFCIYYVANLEKMLATEKAQRLSDQEKIREAGESAF